MHNGSVRTVTRYHFKTVVHILRAFGAVSGAKGGHIKFCERFAGIETALYFHEQFHQRHSIAGHSVVNALYLHRIFHGFQHGHGRRSGHKMLANDDARV